MNSILRVAPGNGHQKVEQSFAAAGAHSEPQQWKYKIYLNNKQMVFCSWSCMEKARKKEEKA